MADYLTEQEQIELLKNWIKQYSLIIVASVVIAFLGISGWRYWQHRQEKIKAQASALFDDMLTMRAQHNRDAAAAQAQKLIKQYPQTIYGQMASLLLARNAAVKKDFPAAERHLNWVIAHSHVDAIRDIARTRLARVLIAQKHPEQVIPVLEKIKTKALLGLAEEIKGDAYLAMNNPALARQAYQQALAALPNAEVIRPLLQMKLDNLATNEV